MGVVCFLDHPSANPRDAVHIVFAGERIRPEHITPSPTIDQRVQSGEFDVVELQALVSMKLNAYCRKDQTHLLDMISVGLIDASWPGNFEAALGQRLQQLLDDPEG